MEISNTFCHMPLFSTLMFLKNLSGIKFSNNLDPDQAGPVAGMIWVQTVCTDYQQKILTGNKIGLSL